MVKELDIVVKNVIICINQIQKYYNEFDIESLLIQS